MTEMDQRLQEYCITNTYKGFKKVKEKKYKLYLLSTHLTFSNGQREIFATGSFKEEALKNIFDKIDSLHNN